MSNYREVFKDGKLVATVYMDEGATEEQWEQVLSSYASMPSAPECPQYVKPFQLRRAMREFLVLEAFNTCIGMMNDDARDRWEYSVEFHREDEMLSTAFESLGYTRAFIDSIFVKADSYS